MEGTVTPVDVKDADFAEAVRAIVHDSKPSPERAGLLVGVVRKQLAFAAERFATGNPERATRSVLGALYLLRVGEGRAEMVDAVGAQALGRAIEQLARRGDDGRAGVLMEMRRAALAQGTKERTELEEHLAALKTWSTESAGSAPMRRAAALQRSAVARALVEPSQEALDAAADAIEVWVEEAFKLENEMRRTREPAPRIDQIEAQRAFETGGLTLSALFLRYGNARGATERLERPALAKVTPPMLQAKVRSVATDDAGRDWLDLAALLSQQDGSAQDPEIGIDPELIRAAAWGSGVEAYRRDPKSIHASLLVARALLRSGMPEASPAVLGEALETADTGGLGACMDVLVDAISDSAEAQDVRSARLTFAAGKRVLDAADKKVGSVEPSSARARLLMAGVELRAGSLDGARPLLESAVAAEPSVAGYLTLAQLERQSGKSTAALAHTDKALSAPDARRAILDVAEALVLRFELLRDAKDEARAKVALDSALAQALAARGMRGNPLAQARAERLLARVLDGYGDGKDAAKALDRALVAVEHDRPTLGTTMLDAVGRALVRKDLPAARGALKRGLDAEVNEEDLVYAGLWVSLLEQELKVAPDGSSERAIKAGGARASWTSKLANWASGKLSDKDLNAAAQSASQKVEAAFYAAMKRRASGDAAAEADLRTVATAPLFDLFEVQIARDLVAPRVKASLPGNVVLP